MKKVITVASIGMALGFAIALANADDNSNVSSSSDTSSSSVQQPGTSGSDQGSATDTGNVSSDQSASDTGNVSSDTTIHEKRVSKSDTLKSRRTCTNDRGVTFKRGEKGFQACISELRRKEQMGGVSQGQDNQQLPSDTSKSKSDRGDMGGTSSDSSSSDSSGSGSSNY